MNATPSSGTMNSQSVERDGHDGLLTVEIKAPSPRHVLCKAPSNKRTDGTCQCPCCTNITQILRPFPWPVSIIMQK